MTVIEEAIYTKLSSTDAVTDLVGTRIYPLKLPQNPTYPAITYGRVSARRGMTHDGPGDMAWPRFQFDCYGASYSAAKGVANAIRSTLNGFSGTVSTVNICAVFFMNEVDDFNDDTEVYRIAVDFRIIHKE